jgi:hypothetical protein
MQVSSVSNIATPVPPIFTSAPSAKAYPSLPDLRGAASSAQIVAEPGGRFVASVDGTTVSGSSVQSVANNLDVTINIFA